jgi:hypothetical protein
LQRVKAPLLPLRFLPWRGNFTRAWDLRPHNAAASCCTARDLEVIASPCREQAQPRNESQVCCIQQTSHDAKVPCQRGASSRRQSPLNHSDWLVTSTYTYRSRTPPLDHWVRCGPAQKFPTRAGQHWMLLPAGALRTPKFGKIDHDAVRFTGLDSNPGGQLLPA